MVFRKILKALCIRIALNWQENSEQQILSDICAYVLAQIQQSPTPIRWSIFLITHIFNIWSYLYANKPFYKLNPSQQLKQIKAWQYSRIKMAKLLVRLYQSLILLKLYRSEAKIPLNDNFIDSHLCSIDEIPNASEVTVVGSGPGGSLTATLLAEAGFQVVLIEEGSFEPAESYHPYSAEEFLCRFRYGGLGVMYGRTPISYLEGRCLGGGSEVNSGIYLRPPVQILAKWNKEFGVKGMLWDDLLPYFKKNERDLKVSAFKGCHPSAGLKLSKGAEALLWECIDTQKWRSYADNDWKDNSRAEYHSMTKSMLPRFIHAGGKILTGTRVDKIKTLNGQWQLYLSERETGKKLPFKRSKSLIISAGAVQSPALLLRSGITKNIGKNLHSSLIIKLIARFNNVVNSETMGMPVQQVREFGPKITFACAISDPAQLALGLQYYPQLNFDFNQTWPYLAAYSVIVSPVGRGRVKTFFNSPMASYSIELDDWLNLGVGLKQLMRCLLKGGAIELYPVMEWQSAIKSVSEINAVNDNLAAYNPPISSIHISSSCCMGEKKSKCAADSYGKVYGQENLYINDAGLLCSYPGANPQATIMAVCRRNVEHFINEQSAE